MSEIPIIQSVGQPVKVEWYVTYRCNLTCLHCHTNSSPLVGTSGDLSTDDGLELVRQMAEEGILSVTFIGGEPLIRRDILSLMETANARGLDIKLSTNAMLINPEMCRLFKDWDIGVQVSLEGVGQYHDMIRGSGSFQRTDRGIRMLLEAGVPVKIRGTLTKYTLRGIPDLLRYCEGLGLDIWLETVWRSGRAVQYWPALGLESNEMEALERAIGGFRQTSRIKVTLGSYFTANVVFADGCAWGDNLMLVIAPDGTIAPCAYALCISDFVPFPRFPDQSLKDIMTRHPYFTFKSKPIEDSLLPRLPDSTKDITRVFKSRVCKVETFKAMHGLETIVPGSEALNVFKEEAQRCSE